MQGECQCDILREVFFLWLFDHLRLAEHNRYKYIFKNRHAQVKTMPSSSVAPIWFHWFSYICDFSHTNALHWSPGADVIYFTALSALYEGTTAYWENTSVHQKVNKQLFCKKKENPILHHLTRGNLLVFWIAFTWNIVSLLRFTDSHFWGILGRNPQGM